MHLLVTNRFLSRGQQFQKLNKISSIALRVILLKDGQINQQNNPRQKCNLRGTDMVKNALFVIKISLKHRNYLTRVRHTICYKLHNAQTEQKTSRLRHNNKKANTVTSWYLCINSSTQGNHKQISNNVVLYQYCNRFRMLKLQNKACRCCLSNTTRYKIAHLKKRGRVY